MPVCTAFVNDQLVQVASSIEDCTSFVLVSSTEYMSLFDAYTLDPETIATAFCFGMGAVITSYLSAYPIQVIKRMLLDDD